jgi:hypothetical protein
MRGEITVHNLLAFDMSNIGHVWFHFFPRFSVEKRENPPRSRQTPTFLSINFTTASVGKGHLYCNERIVQRRQNLDFCHHRFSNALIQAAKRLQRAYSGSGNKHAHSTKIVTVNGKSPD